MAPSLHSPCPTGNSGLKESLGLQQAEAKEAEQQQQQQGWGAAPSPAGSSVPECNLGASDPGSTALVATVVGDRMFVANVGDCRLIVAGELPRWEASTEWWG